MWANPLTFVVEQARSVLIFGNVLDFRGIAIYSLVAIMALASVYWLFQRLRPGFADVF
jgi:lipopolysaccharide transport system permease protein